MTVQLPNFLEDAKKVAGLERDLLILVGHLTLLAFPPQKTENKVENALSSIENETYKYQE